MKDWLTLATLFLFIGLILVIPTVEFFTGPVPDFGDFRIN